MKARYFLPLAAIVLLAGCNKEVAIEEAPQPEVAKTVLEVSIGQDTKTLMDSENGTGGHKVYWSDGDKIAVNGVESDALENLPANTQNASFSFSSVLSTPYNIVYPASIYKDASHVTLPAVQTYKAGGFADGMFPMAGYSADGSNITLSHLCAIVKIQIKRATATDADTDNIVSVRFKGKADEQVSGIFSINYENATLTGTSTAADDKVVKVVKNQATATDAAAVYYVVVPAGTYSNGFDIIVQDKNGHIMTKSKTSSWTASAGTLYNMPEFEFAPTATELGIEISNAQELIQFASDYNNKVFESLGDEPLIATITNNITFDATTSAEFNATGGIGMKNNLYGATEDYYFNGTVNGGNHYIRNLEATVPIFAAIGESGAVNDLIIAYTCSFTFTHPNTAELDAGALVGYNKGIVKNVEVAANVALESGDISQVTALGGVAGRVTIGTIDHCFFTGNLTVPDGFAVNAKKTYVGGLVGSITNADGEVRDSYFQGTIDFAGTVASTDTSNPYLMIGGIVGAVNAGTVSYCSSTDTKTKEITMDNDNSYTATIQNHSRKVYHMAQGGIAGYNAGTVYFCTNDASVMNFVLTTATKGGTASNNNSRYYDVGGIVGLNDANGTVTECTNNGLFESRSTPRIQKIGGVVGYNKGTVESSSNTSTGTIYLTTSNISPYNVRVGEVGGVIGNNSGNVTNVQNAADITVDRTENNAAVELKFGGVIGVTTKAIDGGASKNISNSGNIIDTYSGTTVTTDGLRFGGIVGSAQASVKNVTNSGNLSFQLYTAAVMSKLYMGGIAGDVRNTANVTVSGCENSGEVYFNVNGKAAAHTGNYIGGIIGLVTGEDVETTISDCDNSGYVHVNCNITTAVSDIIAAGIVAKMNESGSITDCNNIGGTSNAGEVNIAFSNATHTDNYSGGIVGKTADSNLAISGCTNSGYIHGGNGTKQNRTTYYVGGIAAYFNGKSSITDCENNGVLLNNHFNNTITKVGSTFEGGIAGFVLGTDTDRITISNVTNDVNNGAAITGGRRGYTGGAVGYGEYVDISNATNTNSYSGGSGYWLGGIAGWLVNSTVSNSTYSGTSIESTQIQGAGGIVCTLDAGSTINGCNSYLNSITHGANACVDGDIAGKSVAGSTIKNCHYTGTYGLCSDTNFTDGGGNAADL